jgi:Flp pilus assembly protein TadD
LDTLYQYYGDEGDTGNLYRVAARLVRVSPNDLQAQNNFAQLSLLLNVETERARSLARELYEGHKADANFASTYAFALYIQGHAQQAVGVMSSLKEDDLNRPEIATYYGIILSAAGDRERARKFLEIGKGARLLPEEKKLFEDALARS